MKIGPNSDEYTIDGTLFEQFDTSIITDGNVHARLDMHKYGTHLDVKFLFEGEVQVPCDRCLEPYFQPIKDEARIIFAFDPEMSFEGYDVMHVNPGETRLDITQEFYDFITLSLPIRLIPETSIHQCSPEVLEYLESRTSDAKADKQSEDVVDPRWEALKKLKFDKEN